VNVTGGVAVFASVPVQRQPQVKTTSLKPLMVWVDADIQSIVQLMVADMISLSVECEHIARDKLLLLQPTQGQPVLNL